MHFPDPDRPLDRLVRARLERDADAGRAAELWRRARRPRLGWAWAPRLIAAAAVLLAVGVLLWPGGQARATAAEAIARAYAVHSDDAGDRRYRLESSLGGGHVSEVWTRGDRFRVAPGPAGGVWGQEGDGRVWVAPTPQAGARFAPDEIPGPLREALLVRAVHLPDLLSELQGTCELSYAGRDIEAVRVRGGSSLSRAQIHVDEGSGVVTWLRTVRDLPRGEVTLTLTLQGAAEQPDAFYELEANLAPRAEVFDRTQRLKRFALLARHGLAALLGQ